MIRDEFSIENQVRATEENLWSLWSTFGRSPGATLCEEEGAVWFHTPLTHLPYNGVIRFQNADAPEPLIDRIMASYEAREVPCMWIVHPTTSPKNLAKLLEARGMQLAEVIPGMTMNLDNLPPREPCPEGVEIREATTDEEIAHAQELISWRWDVPEESRKQHLDMTLSFGVGAPGSPRRCWIAYMDGKPVSKALLNLDANSAGIHGVATKPEARGKGLARALTLEALHVGREAGFRLGMLHSSVMARSLYEKIGFAQVSEFRVYVAGASLHL